MSIVWMDGGRTVTMDGVQVSRTPRRASGTRSLAGVVDVEVLREEDLRFEPTRGSGRSDAPQALGLLPERGAEGGVPLLVDEHDEVVAMGETDPGGDVVWISRDGLELDTRGTRPLKVLWVRLTEALLRRAASRVDDLDQDKYGLKELSVRSGLQAQRLLPPGELAGWGEQRGLLVLHGTGRLSGEGFQAEGAVAGPDLEWLTRRYGERIIAWDHRRFLLSPLDNARDLLQQLPPNQTLHVDVLAQSRGGLVARCLSELPRDTLDGLERLHVHRVMLVSTPGAGTPLADPKTLERILVNGLVARGVWKAIATALSPAVALIGARAARLAIEIVDLLPGIDAMDPNSRFIKHLNAGRDVVVRADAYGAVGAVADDLVARGLDLMQVFDGEHDCIVPTPGVFDPGVDRPGFYPIEHRWRCRLERRGHQEIFCDPKTWTHLRSFFEGDG